MASDLPCHILIGINRQLVSVKGNSTAWANRHLIEIHQFALLPSPDKDTRKAKHRPQARIAAIAASTAARVWLALCFALFGAWVMAGMLAPTSIGFGDAFALSAPVAYASYLLVIKRLRDHFDAATATLWSAAVSAVILAAAAWLHGEKMIPSSAFGWMIVAPLAFLIHTMGQGLTSAAMGRAPVGLVALVILARRPSRRWPPGACSAKA